MAKASQVRILSCVKIVYSNKQIKIDAGIYPEDVILCDLFIQHSLMVRIAGFHPADPGSIPGAEGGPGDDIKSTTYSLTRYRWESNC